MLDCFQKKCGESANDKCSSSEKRLDQQFYVLKLNFEIPQVAYF